MFRIHPKLLTVLAVAAMVLMTAGQYAIWVYAPEEAAMGLVQKVFYFHLPLWPGGPSWPFSRCVWPASWSW